MMRLIEEHKLKKKAERSLEELVERLGIVFTMPDKPLKVQYGGRDMFSESASGAYLCTDESHIILVHPEKSEDPDRTIRHEVGHFLLNVVASGGDDSIARKISQRKLGHIINPARMENLGGLLEGMSKFAVESAIDETFAYYCQEVNSGNPLDRLWESEEEILRYNAELFRGGHFDTKDFANSFIGRPRIKSPESTQDRQKNFPLEFIKVRPAPFSADNLDGRKEKVMKLTFPPSVREDREMHLAYLTDRTVEYLTNQLIGEMAEKLHCNLEEGYLDGMDRIDRQTHSLGEWYGRNLARSGRIGGDVLNLFAFGMPGDARSRLDSDTYNPSVHLSHIVDVARLTPKELNDRLHAIAHFANQDS